MKNLILLCLVPLVLVAVGVGDRPMSREARAQIEDERNANWIQGFLASGYIFDHAPPVYYPASTHWLCSIEGDSIAIEDGSVWKINSFDDYKLLTWYPDDPIVITQNNRWFTIYQYRIINSTTGASVEANLFLAPLEGGAYTRIVTAIDCETGEILLNDNSFWIVSNNDARIFADWSQYDTVIVGNNCSWDSSCDQILINANLNNCIRAKQR